MDERKGGKEGQKVRRERRKKISQTHPRNSV